MLTRLLFTKRWLLWTMLVVLLAAAIVGWQLLVQPIVGLADNGDFNRLLSYANCDPVGVHDGIRSYQYIHRNFHCEPSTWSFTYYTSQLLIVKAAVKLAGVLWKGGHFDLRILTVVQLPIMLLSLVITLAALTRRPFADLVMVGLLLLLIFCDVGYVCYLNSFYSDPGSLLFLLLMTSLTLFLILQEPQGIARGLILCALSLVMLLFVMAKAMNILLGGPLALLLWRLGAVGQGPPLRRWLRASVAPVLLVACCGLYLTKGLHPEIKRTNLYHHMFGELLPSSADPSADLQAFGLPASYASLSGTGWYTPGVPKEDPAFLQTFFAKVHHRSILKFYLERPRRLWGLLARNAPYAFELRPYLGNFEPAVGKPPQALSFGYANWSSLKRDLPSRPTLLLLFLLVNVGVILGKYFWFDRFMRDRLLTEMHASLLLCGGIAYGTILLGEGRGETVRYMMLVSAIFDILLILLLGYAMSIIRSRLASRTSVRL